MKSKIKKSKSKKSVANKEKLEQDKKLKELLEKDLKELSENPILQLERLIYYNETNLEILEEVESLIEADIDLYKQDISLMKLLNKNIDYVIENLFFYEILDNILIYKKYTKRKITAFKKLKKEVSNSVERLSNVYSKN